MSPSRFDLGPADLADLLAGEPRYRAGQLSAGLLAGLDPEAITTLPKALRSRLAGEPALRSALTLVRRSEADNGTTVKWLWRLGDGGALIETVLMHNDLHDGADDHDLVAGPARGRARSTVCVSSQAGCAMGCGFCATGQAGFDGQLSTGEIVEQVVRAAAEASAAGHRVGNVVFMGMGEPFANYDRVWSAIERLHDDLGLSARHLTVSTVGLVPGIQRLASEALPVNLAVSLHAANDVLRDELVPVNRRYPLDQLAAACRAYVTATHRRISLEWALIDGVNDRPVDATELAAFARPLGAHVNLIPLNPTPGFGVPGSGPAKVRGFRDRLRSHGVNATIRRTRGVDIDAACGQLRAAEATSTGAGRPLAD